MRETYKHLMIYMTTIIAISVCVFSQKMVVFAGDINGNEAGVISAASGTFTYDGKTYYAGSAYINSLISYLSSDDVDLTAEQASEAIAMMYGSVQQGVEQGYLYEAGGSTSTENVSTEDSKTDDNTTNGTESDHNLSEDGTTTSTTENSNLTEDGSMGNVTTENNTSANGTTDGGQKNSGRTDDAGKTTGETGEDDAQSAMEGSGEGESDKSESDAADNADNRQDEEKKEQTANEVDVWEAMSNPTEQKKQLELRPEAEDASASVELEEEQIVVTTRKQDTISIEKDKPIISDGMTRGTYIVSGLLFVIVGICGMILFSTKCMTFRKRKSKKARPGHSKRRIIRHRTRAVLTVTTGIGTVAIMLMLGIYVSLFDNDAIMQNMQNSGYFRYAYSEYISEVAEEMKTAVADNTFDAAEQEKIESYEEYLYTIKNNSLKVLNGETNISVPNSNVAPYIYNLKISCKQIISVAGVLCVLSVVFGIILMIYMDERRERGIKHTAASVLCAGVIVGIATLIMGIYKPYLHLYIEPDYLYLFLMECIKQCTMVMVCVTAFGVVFGMILSGIYRNYKS